MDLNRNMVYTGLQLGKNKDLVVKVWLPSWNEPNCWYFPSRNKLCIPDVYFCDFLLLPSISTSIQESSSICLIWYGSGCVQNAALRMLLSSMPFHSLIWFGRITHNASLPDRWLQQVIFTFDQAAQPKSSGVLSCYGWTSWIQVQPWKTISRWSYRTWQPMSPLSVQGHVRNKKTKCHKWECRLFIFRVLSFISLKN